MRFSDCIEGKTYYVPDRAYAFICKSSFNGAEIRGDYINRTKDRFSDEWFRTLTKNGKRDDKVILITPEANPEYFL